MYRGSMTYILTAGCVWLTVILSLGERSKLLQCCVMCITELISLSGGINSDDRMLLFFHPQVFFVLIYSRKDKQRRQKGCCSSTYKQKINSDDRMTAVLPPTSILCVNILWEGEAKDKQQRQNGCCSSTNKYSLC
jgi:hypothetical protein